MYPIACEEDAECGGTTPACLYGRCVGCVDDFDCPSVGTPRCNPVAHACVAGDASCLGDDTAEPEDDGPAGAPVIAVDYGGLGTVTGAVCDDPPAELAGPQMVRTPAYKLIKNPPRRVRDTTGDYELYDLRRDPKEEHNLVNDPGHTRVVAELKAKLEAWQQAVPPPPKLDDLAASRTTR